MRLTIIATAVSLALFGISAADEARASIRRPITIAGQSLDPALRMLAKDRKVQLLYSSELVRDQQTHGAAGDLTFEEALVELLEGTGLTYQYLDEKAVTIVPIAVSAPATHAGGEGGAPRDSGTTQTPELRNSFWDRFRLAQVDQGTSSNAGTVKSESAADTRSGVAVEEVVVTAQKRLERLQDVPIPVTAISGKSLVDQNQLSLQDYYSNVPGLSLTLDNLRGQVNLSIRGLSLNGASPTVGIVVDDVPYGASTSLGGGLWMPDIDPSDLARVEVLRGPQGTLYGASSIGGLLKYATIDPSTEKVSGSVQAGGSSVRNGDQVGYGVRGAINVPLSDTLAIRASGFTRQDPGYIDNPATGVDGINKVETSGGRLSALWQPSQDLSFKVSALFQNSRRFGSSDVNVGPDLGELQNNDVPGTGRFERKVAVYSGTLTARLGIASLTSVTGYIRNQLTDSYDYTSFFGPLTQDQFGVTGTPLLEHSDTDKLTQEIRLSVPLGAKTEWLVGGFYTHERSPHDQSLLAANADTGAIVGEWLYANIPTKYEEYAAFTDVTFHVTDRFDLQIGGRESHDRQVLSEVDTGPYVEPFEGVPSPRDYGTQRSKDNSFTYLVTPRYQIAPGLMAYLRLASGYQPGGPNQGAPTGVPPTFGPSKARNYELGVKGDAFNRALSFDASLYYIDLRDVQLSLTAPNQQGYLANGGGAKSQGGELSVEARPTQGFTIAAWIALSEAVLTDDFPLASLAYGVSGDPLPFSSRFSGNFSLEQEFPVWNGITGFAGGALSYVGHRRGNFQSSAQRQDYPSYAKADIRAGLRQGAWSVNLFINNVADKRGVLVGGLDAIPNSTFSAYDAYNYIPPRTIGLSVARLFE